VPDPIDVRDDGTHEHGREPGWSERLVFAFFDPTAGVGGIARVEFHPGEQLAEGTLNIFVGDGAIATVLAREETPGGGSSVGRIKLDRIAPLEKWRLRCKDIALVFPGASRGAQSKRSGAAVQVDLDLAFEAWTPAAGSGERRKTVDELGFVQVVSSGHFEQAGRYSGRMRVGGRACTIDGSGVRARSWGTRDRTAQHRESWYAVAFGRGSSFSVRAVTLGDKGLRHGWVAQGDEVRDLASLHIETEQRGRGMDIAHLRVIDHAGASWELQAEALEAIPLRDGPARVRQVMTRFRLGDREAIGLAEHLDAAPRKERVVVEPN